MPRSARHTMGGREVLDAKTMLDLLEGSASDGGPTVTIDVDVFKDNFGAPPPRRSSLSGGRRSSSSGASRRRETADPAQLKELLQACLLEGNDAALRDALLAAVDTQGHQTLDLFLVCHYYEQSGKDGHYDDEPSDESVTGWITPPGHALPQCVLDQFRGMAGRGQAVHDQDLVQGLDPAQDRSGSRIQTKKLARIPHAED